MSALLRGAVTGGVSTLLLVMSSATLASSHREAPFIVKMPKVDATDVYAFRSYETGRSGYVTLLANYSPFQDPQGGPNFHMLDEDALYEIHVDNDGDAKEDISFQFRFKNESKDQALAVGGKQTKIPLINSGPLPGTVNPGTLNVRETFTLDVMWGGRRNGVRGACTAGGRGVFDKPADHIGEKTFGASPAYEDYARRHIYDIDVPGCEGKGKGRVFVGQRKEPFHIAVGRIFDLINLNPLGAEVGGNNNDLEGKNVSTIALELPIACLTKGDDPVIGVYSTASLRQGSLLNPTPRGMGDKRRSGGAWTQVSRLGMPLVNEVVIGLADKDRFNASKPRADAQFADYVTHPALPALIETLFPAAKAPTNFPRTDLVAAFLTGLKGLNQPKSVTPSEMLRLNTSTAVTAAGQQNPLGVAAGDTAGFPNGRRPADDVVDIELRVAMGALCVLTGASDSLQVGCKPSDAPAGGLAITDGVRKTAANYFDRFPYLTTPLPGNSNPAPASGTTYP